MIVKPAAEVLSTLDQREAYDKLIQTKLAEVDTFIASVDSTIKQAGLSEEAGNKVWQTIGDVLEKSAVELKGPAGAGSVSFDPEPKPENIPVTAPSRAALPGTMTPEQQLSPSVNPMLDAEQPVTSSMTAPLKAAPPVANAPWGGVDWKDPAVWGKALLGAGGMGLGTLLAGGKKRHALLAALMGGAAAPYLAANAPEMGNWMKGKWQGLTGKA